MQPEEQHCDDVGGGDINILKTNNDHRVNIVPSLCVRETMAGRVCHSEREMKEVVDEKRKDHQAASQHRSRRKRGVDRIVDDVTLSPGSAIDSS